MTQPLLQQREVRAYMVLFSIMMCGLMTTVVTASKIAHIGINFPFSNLIFAIFGFPFVDAICELWGKQVARQTVWLSLLCQFLIALLIHLSIIAPSAAFFHLQDAYAAILSVSGRVVIAGFLAFMMSQLLDIAIYQKLKELSRGKKLWLRSGLAACFGQLLDSTIFISIVFYDSEQKLTILAGSMAVKVVTALLMTPVVYAMVFSVNRYLHSNTLAFSRTTSNLAPASP